MEIRLSEIICDQDSLGDIIDSMIDKDQLKGVQDSQMEIGKGYLVLYTSLNRDNTELLKQGKYTKHLIAFETYEEALGVSQAQFVIKLAYTTKGLYDTLNPKAYDEIKAAIKSMKGIKPSEILDKDILSWIYNHTKCTGVRLHRIDTTKKCYPKSSFIFDKSALVYSLKPSAVKVLEVIQK